MCGVGCSHKEKRAVVLSRSAGLVRFDPGRNNRQKSRKSAKQRRIEKGSATAASFAEVLVIREGLEPSTQLLKVAYIRFTAFSFVLLRSLFFPLNQTDILIWVYNRS